jgi:hypothetical protein
MEFLGGIADSSADGNIVRLPPCLFQPIAADDVAPIVAEVALAAPRNGIVEIAGPERAPFSEIAARYLKAVGDPREVVRDPEARYWGGRVEERSLVPLGEARLGRIGLDEWLRRSQTGDQDVSGGDELFYAIKDSKAASNAKVHCRAPALLIPPNCRRETQCAEARGVENNSNQINELRHIDDQAPDLAAAQCGQAWRR